MSSGVCGGLVFTALQNEPVYSRRCFTRINDSITDYREQEFKDYSRV